MTHLPIDVSVKDFVESKKSPLNLTKSEENRQLLFEKKIRRTLLLIENGWVKSEICRELNMDPRSYDKFVQKSFSTSISKSQKKHLDTVQQKENSVSRIKSTLFFPGLSE